MINKSNIPAKLKKDGKFCLWKWEEKDGRQTKVLYNPITRRRGNSTNPVTFTDFNTAFHVWLDNEKEFNGLGVGIFGETAGIDIDHCFTEAGEITDAARAIIQAVPGYVEKSPSGGGVHILFNPPEGFKYDTETYYINNRQKKIEPVLEVYLPGITNRFLTLTGDTLTPGRDLITANAEALQGVLNKYMKRPPKPEANTTPATPLDFSDAELLEKAKAAGNAKFNDLFNGRWQAWYNSQSEADQALCEQLAFWTGRDPVRIDNLFRQSGLMRDKWKRGKYREETINKAIALCPSVYNPDYRSDTGNGWTESDREGLQDMKENAHSPENDLNGPRSDLSESGHNLPPEGLEAVESESGSPEGQEKEHTPPRPYNTADYLKESFDTDRAAFRCDVKTGFSNLDSLLGGLYSGLYVIAATSSLGKTTFCCEMADKLAAAGNDVLYFSLEQSRFDLLCKSLARIMGETAIANGEKLSDYPSETEIKRGVKSWLTDQARQTYLDTIGDRLSIIEGNFNYGLQDIKENVTAYINANGVKPLIIIDYLQIISPNYKGEKRPLREAIDMIVSELKRFSRDNGLTIILISSVNRASYTEAIDFDSLKESGGIEFTADVCLGLQYSVISENRKLFEDPKTTKAEKQRALDLAKHETPAIIEARVLKNRFGESRKSCKFDYFAGNALFIPTNEFKRAGRETEYKGDQTEEKPKAQPKKYNFGNK